MRRPRSFLAAAASAAVVVALLPLGAAAAADTPIPGAPTFTLAVGDDVAGGTYDIEFAKVFEGKTAEKTPVYIYLPAAATTGGLHSEGVLGLDPTKDPNPRDEYAPCADDTAADHLINQGQINAVGDLLANQIVAVDEAHFGPMEPAVEGNDSTDSLVMLVYNVFDDAYYDCAADSYTAGYFAPDFISSAGMNVIVVDSFDWANRTGTTNPLYEGVVAHELEHLLMNYSNPGELSWVDEGLADMASFLNKFGATGSHVLYHQVFHRETSLTRWGGGLENYGSSYTFFQYLWEQAGGNGTIADDRYKPNFTQTFNGYDGRAGDLLIKLIFGEGATGREGVEKAIKAYNESPDTKDLPPFEQLFQDWAAMTYIDDETSSRFDLKAIDYGADTRGYTVSLANEKYWKKRGQYNGNTPEARLDNSGRSPAKVALPYGASYEEFTRRVGDKVRFEFNGKPTTTIAPYRGQDHWYGGYQSMRDTILNVDADEFGGAVVDFWTWYFIEEGWDYGFVEAFVEGTWETVPVHDDSGRIVTTNDNPYGSNEEGNGLTGTSGGTYFVDEPTYVHLTATLPTGATDVRFRYSTDAAYLDTGWFVDEVKVNGTTAPLSGDGWALTTGTQANTWSVQILSRCDLTTAPTTGTKVKDGGWWVYQWKSDSDGTLTTDTLNTACLGSKGRFVLVVSNMPSGALSFLDATYDYRVVRVKR